MVPPEISRAIGGMGLPRGVLIELLTHIHGVLAIAYEFFRDKRDTDNRLCTYRKILLDENGVKHRFTFILDDSTSPDHLIVANLHYAVDQ
jgi:hypothetical protein